MAGRSSGCSMPGCHDEVSSDLVLSHRYQAADGKWVPSSRITVKHIYLCEKHYEQMLDFMSTYEGRKNGSKAK